MADVNLDSVASLKAISDNYFRTYDKPTSHAAEGIDATIKKINKDLASLENSPASKKVADIIASINNIPLTQPINISASTLKFPEFDISEYTLPLSCETRTPKGHVTNKKFCDYLTSLNTWLGHYKTYMETRLNSVVRLALFKALYKITKKGTNWTVTQRAGEAYTAMLRELYSVYQRLRDRNIIDKFSTYVELISKAQDRNVVSQLPIYDEMKIGNIKSTLDHDADQFYKLMQGIVADISEQPDSADEKLLIDRIEKYSDIIKRIHEIMQKTKDDCDKLKNDPDKDFFVDINKEINTEWNATTDSTLKKILENLSFIIVQFTALFDASCVSKATIAELTKLNAELNKQLENDKANLQNQIAEKEAQITTLANKKNKLEADLLELQKKLEPLDANAGEIVRLKELVATFEADLKNYNATKNALTQLEGEYNELKNAKTECDTKLAELDVVNAELAKLKDQEEQIKELQKQLDDTKAKHKTTVNELEEKLKESNATLGTVRDRNAQMILAIEKLQADLGAEKAKVEELNKAKTELDTANAQLQKQLAAAEAQLKVLQESEEGILPPHVAPDPHASPSDPEAANKELHDEISKLEAQLTEVNLKLLDAFAAQELADKFNTLTTELSTMSDTSAMWNKIANFIKDNAQNVDTDELVKACTGKQKCQDCDAVCQEMTNALQTGEMSDELTEVVGKYLSAIDESGLRNVYETYLRKNMYNPAVLQLQTSLIEKEIPANQAYVYSMFAPSFIDMVSDGYYVNA